MAVKIDKKIKGYSVVSQEDRAREAKADAVARDAAGNITVSAPRSVLVLNSSGTRLVYEENFDDGEAQDWSGLIGTWEVTNGQNAQTGNHYPDIAVYDGDTWETDFVFSASLRTSCSATNNRSTIFAETCAKLSIIVESWPPKVCDWPRMVL